MKILTNARHWKQTAWAVVEISYKPDKDLVRAKLQFITKLMSQAIAFERADTANDFIVVQTSSECSTPEQIIATAIERWQTARQIRESAL